MNFGILTAFVVVFTAMSGVSFAESNAFPNTQSLGERQYESGRTMQPDGASQSIQQIPGDQTQEGIPRISGHCQLKQDIATIAFPCPPVTVVISDTKGKEVFRNTLQDSKFEFTVEKHKDYFLTLDSKTYQSDKAKHGPYKAGDRVMLQIKKKK